VTERRYILLHLQHTAAYVLFTLSHTELRTYVKGSRSEDRYIRQGLPCRRPRQC